MSRAHKFMMTFGLLMFAAGLYLGFSTYRFVSQAVVVDGTVVAMKDISDSDVRYPLVRYTDTAGHQHMLQSHAGSNPPEHYVGEKVKILIDPADPDVTASATIDSFFDLWGAATIVMGLGAAFVLITLLVSYVENHADEDDEADDATVRPATGKKKGDLLGKVINLFLIIGLVLSAVGLNSWKHTHDFVAQAVAVDGTVVAMRSRIGSFVEYPVVRYTDHQGHVRKLYSTAGSNPPAYAVGDKVKVLLNPTVPDFPTTATLDGFFELWGAPTILTGLGAAFVLIPLAFKYLERRGGAIEFGRRKKRG